MNNDNFKRKALFFDIDGTLSVNNLPPHESTVREIRRVREMGHLVFVCTGRVTSYILDDITEIGFDGIVAGAGTFVSVGDKIISQKFMDKDIVMTAAKRYYKEGQTAVFEGENNMYLLNYDDEFENLPVVDSPADFLEGGKYADEKIYKFTAYEQMPTDLKEELNKVAAVIDHDMYQEVVPKNINKATGIQIALDFVGIDKADSVAFGDSPNDIEMIEYVGVGVAMGDAQPYVKEVADQVTAKFKDNGVAVSLKKLF